MAIAPAVPPRTALAPAFAITSLKEGVGVFSTSLVGALILILIVSVSVSMRRFTKLLLMIAFKKSSQEEKQ
jgi:hypothetical protein